MVRKSKGIRVAAPPQLVGEVGVAIQRYQRSVQAFDDEVARAMGLNGTDLRCLDWLADGPKAAGDLARGIGLSPAATTTVVDRLARRGLVERVRDDEDRRRVLVRMTPTGQEETWAHYGPLVEEGMAHTARLDDDQLRLLRDHLDEVRALTDRHRERVAAARDPD